MPLCLDVYGCPNCKKCIGVELAWSGTGLAAHAHETWNYFICTQEKAATSAEYQENATQSAEYRAIFTKPSGLCFGARVKLTEYGAKKIEEVRSETAGEPWSSNLYPKNRVFKADDPGVLLHADADDKGIWNCDLGGMVIYVDDKMVEVVS